MCNCCVKYGGKGRSNTPYKQHIWDCQINVHDEYPIDWKKAVNSVEKIINFYRLWSQNKTNC